MGKTYHKRKIPNAKDVHERFLKENDLFDSPSPVKKKEPFIMQALNDVDLIHNLQDYTTFHIKGMSKKKKKKYHFFKA